jgi:hypothetical protein
MPAYGHEAAVRRGQNYVRFMRDAVEKVDCVRRRRNNRIRINSVLIPYCVLDPVFESMLLAEPPSKSFFNSIWGTAVEKCSL